MGMYTGLKGKIRFNDSDFGNIFHTYFADCKSDILGLGFAYWTVWDFLKEIHPDVTKSYPQRIRHIFLQGDDYMPDDWMCYPEYDIETRTITFSSALKNYDNDISTFITIFLPKIADAWYLIELYEDDETPTEHSFNSEVL